MITGQVKPKQEEEEVKQQEIKNTVQEQPKVEKTPPKPDPKHFRMVKNVAGSMAILLEAHDFSTPPRRIFFRYDEDSKLIPVKWAIGVFVSDSALRQMEGGYFTFENLEVLIEMAERMGQLVPESIKEPKITLKEIRIAVTRGEQKDLKRILLNANRKVRNDVISVAQQYYNTLNMNTINFLEKELKVSIKPVELNG